MKHFFTILLLAVCVSLIACAHDTVPSNTTGSDNRADQTVETFDGGERPLLGFWNYDDYNEFIHSTELPSDFVPYEAVASIGKFDGFVCLTDARQNDYGQYMYDLIDDNGFNLMLYVDHRTEKPFKIELKDLTAATADDLRFFADGETGIAARDDLKYTYIKGKLLSVEWESQGITFTLCANMMLSDYPLDTSNETFASRLLTPQKAGSAVQALQQTK